MAEIRHIDWTRPEYEDRLILRFADSDIIERAEMHAAIRGVMYAVVRKQSTHSFGVHTHFETYVIGKNGFASRITWMNDIPVHYEATTDSGVILVHCNDYGDGCQRISNGKARDDLSGPP